ncbi:1,5-anhydro-D-fructose reductase-like [Rhodnius prolixus]
MTLNKDSVITAGDVNIPVIGLGTWMSSEDEIEKAIDAALECGYRLIDTAYVYYNEKSIGKALNKWLESGKIRREDLFIVTKLPLFGCRAEHVEYFLKKSLENLQLSYVDLYLIHNPVGLQLKNEEPFPRDESGRLLLDMDTDHLAVWKEMEKQVNEGRTRSIGVSNFNLKQLKRIVENSQIKPVNNQVEMHIYLQQRDLVDYCKENDVGVCAYGPLGSPSLLNFTKNAGISTEGVPQLTPLTDPVVGEIAKRYNKTPSQILLRFLIQYGVTAIPKSTNPDRIRLNFDIFDFELNADDYDQLLNLDKGEEGRLFAKGIFSEMTVHPEYPF